VASGDDGRASVILVHEVRTGALVSSWRGHGGSDVRELAFTPSGLLVAAFHVGGWRGVDDPARSKLKFWSIALNQPCGEHGLGCHSISAMAISPDGSLIAAGGNGVDVEVLQAARPPRAAGTEGVRRSATGRRGFEET